jgi:hypothetical protein
MIAELPRLARRAHPERVPRAVEDEPGIFAVDATWGVIQPISLAPGVRTVGELEVMMVVFCTDRSAPPPATQQMRCSRRAGRLSGCCITAAGSTTG